MKVVIRTNGVFVSVTAPDNRPILSYEVGSLNLTLDVEELVDNFAHLQERFNKAMFEAVAQGVGQSGHS